MSLGFLFFENLSNRDASAFSCAAPVRELFEAACVDTTRKVRFLVLGILMEGLHDVGLDTLLVGEDIPTIGDFLIGVFGKMENRSDHDDFVERNRHIIERSDHDDLVEGD